MIHTTDVLMLNGMAVVVSPAVPQFHVADELVPIWPWWRVIYWLFTFHNPTPSRYKAGKPIMEERAYRVAGKLFVSPRMWEQIRAYKVSQ